jgi:frataxin-like iron-binding protein CyaY
MAVGRSDFEERKKNRINHLEEKAEKASNEAEQQYNKSHDAVEGIELGQPILIGHHSEKKHRAAVKKMRSAMEKSVDSREKSAYYQEKVEKAEKNKSISGDDPEAVNRYKTKLKKLEAVQAYMKAANAYWRKNKTMKGFDGLSDEEAEKIDERMKTAYSWVQKSGPYEDWRLKNNNAEIRRIKEQLENLENLDSMEAETITFMGGEMRINTEINRVQFIFDSVPSEEVRSLLKHNGFKWAPSEGAWQRQRTQIAVNTAKSLIPKLEGK